MTTRRIITGLVAAGGVLAGTLAGGAPGTAAHSRAGSPALATSGPYAFSVAVDATAGHAFVLSARTDNTDISGSPAGQGYLSMLDARTGRLLRTVPVGLSAYALGVDERTAHAFVANQSSISTSQGSISMVDTRTGNVLRTVPLGRERFLTLAGALSLAVASRVGRLFVATAGTGDQVTLQMLDTRAGTLLRSVPRRMTPSLDVVPGAQMAVDEMAGRVFLAPWPTGSTLNILDARTGASLRTVTLGGSIVGLAVDEADARLLVETAAPHHYGVSFLDARTGTIRHTTILGGASIVRAIPLLQPGRTLSAGLVVDERTGHAFVITGGTNRSGNTLSGHGRVTMLDARSGRVLHTATIAAFPIAAVVDARVGRLLVADGAYGPANAVSVLDTHNGALVRSVRVRAVGVSFFTAMPLAVDAHSGRAFLVNRSSNSVSVLATRSGTLLRTVALRPAPASP